MYPRPFLSRPAARLLMLLTLFAACSPNEARTNLALRRPARHSSAIDFNATAQLAVDGIVETEMPCWVEVCGNGGKPLSKREHDLVFDPRQWTNVTADGPRAELAVRTHGFTEPVDRISMTLAARLSEGLRQAAYTAEFQQLDGKDWRCVQAFKGIYRGGRLTLDWPAPALTDAAGWRVVVDMPGAASFEWQEWRFYRDGRLLPMLTSERFSSVWVSATGGQEWITVDLGDQYPLREVRLHWLNAPAKGVLQVGVDSTSWRDLAALDGNQAMRCDTLRVRGKGRWIRLLLERSTNDNPYILSELEVFSSSRTSAKNKNASAPAPARQEVRDGRLNLNQGWKLARLPQASDPAAWIPATVPGTVLVSYLDNGILPDPNFGDNQQYISDSYFNAPFIYHCRFALPPGFRKGTDGEQVRLRFDGINWKADVRLNGHELGRIEGAFTDASFPVSNLMETDNLLEVTVFPPAHPGAAKINTLERCATNGGILGADNPTFHASIGWDWIPTIRGRNMGIWNDVWLERFGAVRILNPNATATLNAQESLPPVFDKTSARITLTAMLANDSDKTVETVWEGRYGEVPFRQEVTVPAGESKPVTAVLDIPHPELWWPNGYGEPHLYDVSMRVGDSDSLHFRHGIRQLTYDASGENLRIWINGRRLIGRGGNWGFSESNLRFKASDYDLAMQLHRHENFNLVRNWVGMVGDEEFYEAADRNGILIWQDFWLANPADGPDPDDEALFMANAENLLMRIRRHPSLLLWCGRNEGYPPASLDKALRALVAREDPASYYLSSSADGEVSGRGPYSRLPLKEYFHMYEMPGQQWEAVKFHSERGMPNFPNYESLVEMMPADQAWPPSDLWGIHDFALHSAQKGSTFLAAVDAYFGPSSDARTFASRAQWVNYDGYRALFESRSLHRRGLLLWMSHPAWPSMAFCTYDWFFDATASYYACRKACEPIHIQWNPYKEQVEVVNYSAGDRTGLKALAQLYDLRGELVAMQEVLLDAREDSTNDLDGIRIPEETAKLSDSVCFLRLQLYQGEELLSHNDYFLPRVEDDLRGLNKLPAAALDVTVDYSFEDQCYKLTLTNPGEVPALMLHLTARGYMGRRILPILCSDNYIHLLPGETRELTVRQTAGSSHAKAFRVEGFNLAARDFPADIRYPER